MRIAVLKKDRCKAPVDCEYLCRKFCPRVRTGDKTIEVGEDRKPIINEGLCVGCGICVKKCDYEAITIVNLPQELDRPIHKYGKNGFRLFGLPAPQKGKVIGFVGPNGTGKTTALDVLSGNLIPNLGEDLKQGDISKVLENFAGTELQAHFERVASGEIKVATKPQNISSIPGHFKGKKVKGLIKKAGLEEDSQLVRQLELASVMDNEISNLSGGELQRLAIAATLAKEADIYFIDEPSSFLDIGQRLAVANVIKSFAEEKGKSMVVVEHDLTTLDYLSDFVYLFYGRPTIYGIVSLPKTQRVGINIYLDGYSKDENMRFRDEAVVFTERAPTEDAERPVLISFKNLEKKLGGFTLIAKKGDIRKQEVVGVLGVNGIGKTTLVKILAGALELDRGSMSRKVKVSYKPQYIHVEKGEIVGKVVGELEKEASDLNFEADILEPFQLRPLLTKKLTQLSGGELQRVAIATTLAKKVDVYLLDEPAAFLDVEQRVVCAKAIKKLMEKRGTSALVVDHDIMFIDYLASRLLVFSGQPAVRGEAFGPVSMREGMNLFLKELGITLRRDPDSKRPRINKLGSKLDQEQKSRGEFYYVS